MKKDKKKPYIFPVLVVFTIFLSLFVPTYIKGMNENVNKEISKLMIEREVLLEERNKELSDISSLMTPEMVYPMAKDQKIKLVELE